METREENLRFRAEERGELSERECDELDKIKFSVVGYKEGKRKHLRYAKDLDSAIELALYFSEYDSVTVEDIESDAQVFSTENWDNDKAEFKKSFKKSEELLAKLKEVM